jgi:hypothetical protein
MLKNYPFKTMRQHLIETIQSITVPGLSLQTVNAMAMNNLRQAVHPPHGDVSRLEGSTFPHTTVNKIYPGTSSYNDVIEGTNIQISFKNSIINWMYIYLAMVSYYNRTRSINDFEIDLDLYDSTQLPMIRFRLRYCFVSNLPNLEFSSNTQFNELKMFDAQFTFNKFDVEFLVPDFNSTLMMFNNTNE